MSTPAITASLCEHLRATGFFCATEVPLVTREVKQSRADFLRDVDSGKAEAYADHARRVYYAVPQGLVKKSEVPDGIGLMVLYETGWRTLQAPKPGPCVEPNADLLLLLMARWSQVEPDVRRLATRIAVEENIPLHRKAKTIGFEVGARLRNGHRSPRDDVALRLLDMVEKAMGESIVGDALAEARRRANMDWKVQRLVPLAVAMLDEAERLERVGEYVKALGGGWTGGNLAKLGREIDRRLPPRQK